MLQEFKKFAMRGNVVDLAVGVIIGAAFSKIIDSLVNDIIMPVIGRIAGGLDFTNYFIGLTEAASKAPTYDAAKKAGAALGYGSIEEGYRRMYGEGNPRVHPFLVPRAMPSAPASQVCMDAQIRGPSFNIASACASATHAIGVGFQMIRGGMLDVCVAGGCEAPLTLGFMRSWDALRVVARDTCRPFSRNRSGLVLGEAAGAVVLEDMDRAKARGATILGEVVGFGMSSDAGDITASDPQGGLRAIQAALADADIDADRIDYVQAHGTGTVLNDRNEVQALRAAFGERLSRLPISSGKAMLGHTLCASGAMGVVFTTLALLDGLLPPTMSHAEDDPELGIDCVPNAARPAALATAMTNSFAFGGLNAVLVQAR